MKNLYYSYIFSYEIFLISEKCFIYRDTAYLYNYILPDDRNKKEM